MDDDPLRMFLVLRRGAVGTLERAAVLGGAAAVACVREYDGDPVLEAWRPRPGKVCLRARNHAQWREVLELPHALAGDPDGESVAALPPRRRSERAPVLERLQAMSTDLGEPPAEPHGDALVYALNPRLRMSSGKVVAQVAHAAVIADWDGEATLYSPVPDDFDALCSRDDLAAKVVDAGLTEVPPGTVTVLALFAR
jgi:hypothetical protein